MDQDVSPAVVAITQRAVQLAQGLPTLPFGFGVDQVPDPLGLGKIQLAVLEGPPGKLARLSHAQAQFGKGLEQRLHHGPAAVHVELGGILPGIAGRALEEEHQRLVQRDAAMPQTTQARHAWRRNLAGQGSDSLARAGTRHPNDSHSGSPGRRGQGEDRWRHQSRLPTAAPAAAVISLRN